MENQEGKNDKHKKINKTMAKPDHTTSTTDPMLQGMAATDLLWGKNSESETQWQLELAGYRAKVWRAGQRTPSWCSFLPINKIPRGYSTLYLEKHILHSPKPQEHDVVLAHQLSQGAALTFSVAMESYSRFFPNSCLLWSPSLMQIAASHHRELIPLHSITNPQNQSWRKGP